MTVPEQDMAVRIAALERRVALLEVANRTVTTDTLTSLTDGEVAAIGMTPEGPKTPT